MIDPGSSSSGGGGDIWAYGGPASTAALTSPSGFREAVLSALLARRIDITALAPSQIDSLVDAVWADGATQDIWNLYEGSSASNVLATATNLRDAIDAQLFDPLTSTSPTALQTGLTILESQRIKLTTDQQQYVLTGAGGGSDIRNIIIQVAQEKGVDPALALAIAQEESGLNPNAHHQTSQEDSWGLFQLNTMGGEGSGMTQAQLTDPRTNAETALARVAEVEHAHPDWSPGQIAAEAQRADNTGNKYANVVDALYDQIKGGKLPTPGRQAAEASIEQQYPGIVSTFERFYGRKPTLDELQNYIGMTPDQMTQVLRMQPSHIPGLSNGMYQDTRANLDRISNEIFGHGVTDGMVADAAQSGDTSPAGLQYYLSQKDIKMSRGVYDAIVSANAPYMSGIYNAGGGFDPAIAIQQYNQATAAGITDAQILAHARHVLARDIAPDLGGPDVGSVPSENQPPQPPPSLFERTGR